MERLDSLSPNKKPSKEIIQYHKNNLRGIRLIFVVNVDWFFLSHRLPLALEAIKRGYDVTLIAKDTGMREDVEKAGIGFIDIPFERAKINLVSEYRVYKKLRSVYTSLHPHIIHHVTLKPIILGSLAAGRKRNIRIVNAVSGLGILFSKNSNKIKRHIVLALLRIATGKRERTHFIFQNAENKRLFVQQNITQEKSTTIIKGSGIDLNDFHCTPIPISKDIKVLVAGRMLYGKGFEEFSKAAKIIKQNKNYSHVTFEMAGMLDTQNPEAIKLDVIRRWEKERQVKWHGHVTNMKKLITESSIIVYPSYYGEGIPKFLIEACALGRPIITTNSVGCKDCVIEGINGFLAPVKNVEIMVDFIMKLLDNYDLRKKMGIESRKLAEKEFSIKKVLNETFAIYDHYRPSKYPPS